MSRPQEACYWFGATLAFAEGVIAVGAPRARRPCSATTRGGAVFTFAVPEDGVPLTGMAELPRALGLWWPTTEPTFLQTSFLLPSERL